MNTIRHPQSAQALNEGLSALEKKYAGLNLLEGVVAPHQRKIVAAVMENTALEAQSNFGRTFLGESETTTANVGNYVNTIFPLLRRVMTNLISPFIMSTQPLLGPSGLVFYRETKRGTSKGRTTAGDNTIQTLDTFYSSQRVVGQQVGVGTGAQVTFSGTLPFAPVFPFNSDFGTAVVITDGTEQFVDNGAGVLVGDDGGTGTINYATGAFSVTFNVAPGNGDDIEASFQYNQESNSNIPTLSLDITSQPVQAESRKLRVDITLEALDDLRRLHGIDGMMELFADAAREIALEIDRDNLNMLITGAQHLRSYTYSPTSTTFLGANDSVQELVRRIGAISSLIHQTSQRAPANFIVCGTEIANLLDSMSIHRDYNLAFVPAADPNARPIPGTPPTYGATTSNAGVRYLGTLANKYAVYQDLYMNVGESTKQVLIGFKGEGYLDAGAAYMPYIPVEATPAFTDPSDQVVRQGFRTRFTKKLLRPEMYGVLSVTGVPQ